MANHRPLRPRPGLDRDYIQVPTVQINGVAKNQYKSQFGLDIDNPNLERIRTSLNGQISILKLADTEDKDSVVLPPGWTWRTHSQVTNLLKTPAWNPQWIRDMLG